MKINSRAAPRFTPTGRIPAAIETDSADCKFNGLRMVGHLRDISKGGISIEHQPCESFAKKIVGTKATAEIYFSGQLKKFSGEICRVDFNKVAIRLSSKLDESVLKEIAGDRSGALYFPGGKARILGVMSYGVGRDLLEAASHASEIDLSGVTAIDSAGIGGALLALERNVRFTNCPDKILPLMVMSGVCTKCNQPVCDERVRQHRSEWRKSG